MLKIALTGNIGSGKSTIARIFEALEVPVYNADYIGHVILSETAVIDEIGLVFGKSFVLNGTIDRKALANVVFGNKEALNMLNAIIHPKVMDRFFKYCAHIRSERFVIFESALIFEAELSHFFDKTILVYAPLEVKIERVINRDNCDRKSVLNRLTHQIDDALKLQKADHVIVNDDSELIIPQVLCLYKQYSL